MDKKFEVRGSNPRLNPAGTRFEVGNQDNDSDPMEGKQPPSVPPLVRGNNLTDTVEGKDVNYWRSFAELYDDPQFIEAQKHEFAKGVSEAPDVSKLSALSRRKFLALLGASAALAAAGCSNYRDKGEVIPYNKKPEEVVLGIPNYYASTCTGCNSACGILIKTREGRPIKVDGNPDHPVNKGKICTKGQASTLNMYDPDRLREPLQKGSSISWQDVDDKIINELKSASSSGKSIAIITNTILSPTQKKLFDEFQSTYPTARIYSYEVISEEPRKNAWVKSYGGKKMMPTIKWDEAKVILALESDFLGSEGNVMEQTRLFSQNRDVMNRKEFNKLYAVEGGYTLTGMNADYRIRLRTDAIEEFVMCLLNEFIVRRKNTNSSNLSNSSNWSSVISTLNGYSLEEFKNKYGLPEPTVKYLVDDLLKNQGSAIVIAGSKLPESTHIAVNLLNEVLGNSKLYSQQLEEEIIPLSTKAELDGLMYDMKSGKTGVVIHYGTNPVFGLSSDYNYADALSKVPTVITMAELMNESAELSTYVLPVNHCFESWGDYKIRTGFLSLQQPVIAPIFNTRQKEAIILTWLRGDKNAYNDKIYRDYLMSNWEKSVYPMVNQLTPFKNFWQASLHDGVAYVKEASPPAPLQRRGGESDIVGLRGFQTDAFVSNAGKMRASKDFVVLFQDNGAIGADGRFANNGWLQELPHPVTKIVWDNYATVSLQTSIDLGVRTNDKIEIKIGDKSAEMPVCVQPGLADNVIEVQPGYGRKTAGTIGSGIGRDVNKLIHAEPQLTSRLYNNATVTKVSGTYELVSTIEHYLIEQTPLLKDVQFKRNIIQEGTYQEYKKNPQFLQKKIAAEKAVNEFPSITKEHEYKYVKWGMAIDLNKCTGCSACIIACTAENNVPVVGKDQVAKSREMIWLRIDRYYSGTPEAPKANFQPMLCQHCDYAPCENVCPVVATTHSPDGLNQMTYNRCVGTRYCSNNCPYKVRRFNYFNFRDRVADQFYMQEPVELMYNPEVTVRSRGVMEKCTFCVQRIMNEKQKAAEEHRQVKGSNVTTACQDACPSYAIVFGDINEGGSEIAKQREHELGYNVLDDLKVRPNITYIAKLRNVI